MTVARVTCLLAAEQGLPVNQEQVYAAGLLHDIGRHLQYQQNIPHEQAGAEIAEGILIDCGFDRQERSDILRLIGANRQLPKKTRCLRCFTGRTSCPGIVFSVRRRTNAIGRRKRKIGKSPIKAQV